MGDKTGIEWADATWNPLRGCSRVSDGCRHCYAETVAHRFSGPGMPYEGLTRIVNGRPTWTGEIRLVPELLDQPLRWKRPRRIFVNSMSDLFHENVPDSFIDRVFAVMWACHFCDGGQSKHVFQILTKRAQRMRDYLKQDRRENWARAAVNIAGKSDPDGLFDDIANAQGSHPRIWLGVSVENQATADERIPLLLETPAAIRWISAEPLLGAIDLWPSAYLPCPNVDDCIMDPDTGAYECCRQCDYTGVGNEIGIDWVVAGGESGPRARPMHPAWARSLRDQCAAAGVAFHFKQWGEWAPRGGEITGGGIDFSAIDPQCTRWPLVIRLGEHGLDTRCGENCGAGIGEEIFMQMVGKKAAGRRLDGVLHDEYPEGVS